MHPLRHSLLRLCVRENAFDFGAYEALNSTISLVEAKEIEAVLCVEGDIRHTFQEWYGDWRAKQKPAKRQPVEDVFASLAGECAIDIEVVQRELKTTSETISETMGTLQKHRLAAATGGEGLDHRIVDVLENQLEGLKNAKAQLEAQLMEALPQSPPRTGEYVDELSGAGPVQSGTLRKVVSRGD